VTDRINIITGIVFFVVLAAGPLLADTTVEEANLLTIRVDEQGHFWWQRRLAGPDNIPRLLAESTKGSDTASFRPNAAYLYDFLLAENTRNPDLMTRVLVHPRANYVWLDTLFSIFDRLEAVISGPRAHEASATPEDLANATTYPYRCSVREWNERDYKVASCLTKVSGSLDSQSDTIGSRDTFAERVRRGYWKDREDWFEPLRIEPSILVLLRPAVAPGTNSSDSRASYPDVLPSFVHIEEPTALSVDNNGSLPEPVAVRALISADGEPLHVTLARPSGDVQYDSLAVEAARRCRFSPAMRNGQPVSAWISFKYSRR
jgi:TonB family protein